MSGSPRLSDANWTTSRYDRAAMRLGVVHLGLGAFHRAHQAPVFDALLAGGDMRWGIVGVAMRSPGLVAALKAQDGLYSLAVRDGQARAPQIIGALGELHVAANDPQAVVAAIAGRDTHLVTLTVTEKGYLDHGADGPAGLIALGLEQRRRAGLGPITVLSCDNRAGNGPFARNAVLAAGQAAGIADAGLRWIEDRVAFPSTMVDRITPATTPAMPDETSDALGLRDEAAVWTEPYWQWVIEDRFAAERPDFASVGVQLVADVAPWEAAKLRLLNAAHSALAYLGLLKGHRFVHEAIVDNELAQAVEALWDEAEAGLDGAVVDLAGYRAALLRRFANPALPHALIQIAADGSQKLPPRLLAGMTERRASGLRSPAMANAVAAWMAALAIVDGLADPLLDTLRVKARVAAASEIVAAGLLQAIGASSELAGEVASPLDRLHRSAIPGVEPA